MQIVMESKDSVAAEAGSDKEGGKTCPHTGCGQLSNQTN